MAWIESHQELRDHPKTRRLARYLGIHVREAVGLLHFLWWWALDYAEDGDLSRFEAADIADAILWDGDPNEAVDALVRAGFLDRTDSGLVIHDWDEYAGRLVEKRRQNAERKRRSRARHAAVTRDTQGRHGATLPNQTEPNHNPPVVPPCTTEEREILGVLKAVDGYPFDFARDLEHIRALAVEFPQVDLLAEARRWAAYKRDKPLKPKSNPRLQFRNWCEKAMEFGRARKQQEVIRDDREYEALFRR